MVSDGYDEVNLIGVGKSQHMSSLSNWTNGNNASVCADLSGNPTWNTWDASQRDLYILDHEGNVVFHENVTGGIPFNLNSIIIELISQIPDDSLLGDISGDGVVNVLDVVAMVNLVLGGSFNEVADMNSDGTLNVLDVVLLVGIILG